MELTGGAAGGSGAQSSLASSNTISAPSPSRHSSHGATPTSGLSMRSISRRTLGGPGTGDGIVYPKNGPVSSTATPAPARRKPAVRNTLGTLHDSALGTTGAGKADADQLYEDFPAERPRAYNSAPSIYGSSADVSAASRSEHLPIQGSEIGGNVAAATSETSSRSLPSAVLVDDEIDARRPWRKKVDAAAERRRATAGRAAAGGKTGGSERSSSADPRLTQSGVLGLRGSGPGTRHGMLLLTGTSAAPGGGNGAGTESSSSTPSLAGGGPRRDIKPLPSALRPPSRVRSLSPASRMAARLGIELVGSGDGGGGGGGEEDDDGGTATKSVRILQMDGEVVDLGISRRRTASGGNPELMSMMVTLEKERLKAQEEDRRQREELDKASTTIQTQQQRKPNNGGGGDGNGGGGDDDDDDDDDDNYHDDHDDDDDTDGRGDDNNQSHINNDNGNNSDNDDIYQYNRESEEEQQKDEEGEDEGEDEDEINLMNSEASRRGMPEDDDAKTIGSSTSFKSSRSVSSTLSAGSSRPAAVALAGRRGRLMHSRAVSSKSIRALDFSSKGVVSADDDNDGCGGGGGDASSSAGSLLGTGRRGTQPPARRERERGRGRGLSPMNLERGLSSRRRSLSKERTLSTRRGLGAGATGAGIGRQTRRSVSPMEKGAGTSGVVVRNAESGVAGAEGSRMMRNMGMKQGAGGGGAGASADAGRKSVLAERSQRNLALIASIVAATADDDDDDDDDDDGGDQGRGPGASSSNRGRLAEDLRRAMMLQHASATSVSTAGTTSTVTTKQTCGAGTSGRYVSDDRSLATMETEERGGGDDDEDSLAQAQAALSAFGVHRISGNGVDAAKEEEETDSERWDQEQGPGQEPYEAKGPFVYEADVNFGDDFVGHDDMDVDRTVRDGDGLSSGSGISTVRSFNGAVSQQQQKGQQKGIMKKMGSFGARPSPPKLAQQPQDVRDTNIEGGSMVSSRTSQGTDNERLRGDDKEEEATERNRGKRRTNRSARDSLDRSSSKSEEMVTAEDVQKAVLDEDGGGGGRERHQRVGCGSGLEQDQGTRRRHPEDSDPKHQGRRRSRELFRRSRADEGSGGRERGQSRTGDPARLEREETDVLGPTGRRRQAPPPPPPPPLDEPEELTRIDKDGFIVTESFSGEGVIMAARSDESSRSSNSTRRAATLSNVRGGGGGRRSVPSSPRHRASPVMHEAAEGNTSHGSHGSADFESISKDSAQQSSVGSGGHGSFASSGGHGSFGLPPSRQPGRDGASRHRRTGSRDKYSDLEARLKRHEDVPAPARRSRSLGSGETIEAAIDSRMREQWPEEVEQVVVTLSGHGRAVRRNRSLDNVSSLEAVVAASEARGGGGDDDDGGEYFPRSRLLRRRSSGEGSDEATRGDPRQDHRASSDCTFAVDDRWTASLSSSGSGRRERPSSRDRARVLTSKADARPVEEDWSPKAEGTSPTSSRRSQSVDRTDAMEEAIKRGMQQAAIVSTPSDSTKHRRSRRSRSLENAGALSSMVSKKMEDTSYDYGGEPRRTDRYYEGRHGDDRERERYHQRRRGYAEEEDVHIGYGSPGTKYNSEGEAFHSGFDFQSAQGEEAGRRPRASGRHRGSSYSSEQPRVGAATVSDSSRRSATECARPVRSKNRERSTEMETAVQRAESTMERTRTRRLTHNR